MENENPRPAPARGLACKAERFAAIGIFCFAIDYGCMVAAMRLLALTPVQAAAIGFCVSLAVNYALSMRYVFSGSGSRSRDMVTFVLGSAVGLAINEAVVWAGIQILGDGMLGATVTKMGATATVMVWNFCTRCALLDRGAERESEKALAELEDGLR